MIAGKNKELYYTESIDKQLNIEVIGTKHVIDNTTREQDTFTLTETLNDGTELKFGSCMPNQISFTGREVPIATKGMKLRPVEILEGNEDDPFVYGTYTVQSDTPTADRTKRQIVAYDAMYDIINVDAKSWYDGLSFPMTLKAFRDSFFAHLGIEQKETSLVNDSMTVNKTLVTTQSEDSSVTAEATISGKTIIEAICEINGAFGNIGRDGRFEYVILPSIVSALYPAEDLYPADDLFPSDANTESMAGHYITFDYESFQSKAITQLEIRADDSTAGAVVGNAGNTYVISGNCLISDKTGAELEQIANNLLPIMKQAAYTPIKSCTCVGNPCLELGDPIRFNTSQEIVETYILQRTLTGVQSKRDSISAQGTQTHSAKVNSIRDTLESVQRRTSKLERNADHLQSTYENLEDQTNSKFEQTANSISAEVNRAQKAEGQLDASLSLKLGRDENDQVVSMINASADHIVLTGNRLIIESNNFQLDAAGNVYIVESLGFKDSEYGHNVDIISLSGQGTPMLQNIDIDMSTVTDGNGNGLITYDDIPVTGFSGDSKSGVYNSIHMNGTIIDGSKISYDDLKHQLSDERLKRDISSITGSAIEDFYMNLIPTRHKYKYGVGIGEDGKYQFGVIAQWTEKDMIDHAIDPDSYSIVCKSKPLADTDEAKYTAGDDVYRVDYSQFHALHIYMIQKQQREIESLKLENFQIKGELDILKQILEKLEEMLDVINSKIN